MHAFSFVFVIDIVRKTHFHEGSIYYFDGKRFEIVIQMH